MSAFELQRAKGLFESNDPAKGGSDYFRQKITIAEKIILEACVCVCVCVHVLGFRAFACANVRARERRCGCLLARLRDVCCYAVVGARSAAVSASEDTHAHAPLWCFRS